MTKNQPLNRTKMHGMPCLTRWRKILAKSSQFILCGKIRNTRVRTYNCGLFSRFLTKYLKMCLIWLYISAIFMAFIGAMLLHSLKATLTGLKVVLQLVFCDPIVATAKIISFMLYVELENMLRIKKRSLNTQFKIGFKKGGIFSG